jgi:ABC-2 type transport system ATP-binding protein
MKNFVIDIHELTRSFGSKTALDRVSFHAAEGRVYGLVGANGAGKTTLLKHLLGLLRPTTGTVRVFGLDPVRDPVGVLGRVGYLSEERELPEWMRIDELMRYTQAFHPTWDAAYARELIETFALDQSNKIKELSKGMRAQVGLVAAVAHRPDLLILDEPSSGLDAVVRRDILDAVVRTVADDGRTVIFSSHLLDEVERMSDHVTMMHLGRVTLSGPLDDLRSGYQRSRVRFVEHFDQPPVLDAALAMEGGGRTWSVVHSGSLEQFHHSVLALGGEVVESRDATLEEIFLARAGRTRQPVEAASAPGL